MIKRMAAAFLTAVFLDGTGAGLLPTEEAPEGAKVRLVYGTIGINYIIKDKIQKFNAANKEYYISLATSMPWRYNQTTTPKSSM